MAHPAAPALRAFRPLRRAAAVLALAGALSAGAVLQQAAVAPAASAAGPVAAGPVSGAFTDVPAGAPFAADIQWMRDRQISTGWSDGTYRPGLTVDREAMAAFLYRLAGSPQVTLPSASPFSDVTPSSQHYREIVWAQQAGVTTGWRMADGTSQFRPAQPIQRDAMAAFLFRYAGSPAHAAPTTDVFADVHAATPFAREVAWMKDAWISTGWSDGTYRPADAMRRDAMAAFLHRISDAGFRFVGTPVAPAPAPKPTAPAPSPTAGMIRCDVDASQATAPKVVLVVGRGGSKQTTRLCDRIGGAYWTTTARTCTDGTVGYNGIAAPGAKRAGDGRTPSGTFELQEGAGILPRPAEYKKPYTQVWNRHFIGFDYSKPAQVNHLQYDPNHRGGGLTYQPAFNYFQVIGYNQGPGAVEGRGGAILLHVNTGSGRTAGCVSQSQAHILQLFAWEGTVRTQIQIRQR